MTASFTVTADAGSADGAVLVYLDDKSERQIATLKPGESLSVSVTRAQSLLQVFDGDPIQQGATQ